MSVMKAHARQAAPKMLIGISHQRSSLPSCSSSSSSAYDVGEVSKPRKNRVRN